MPPLRLLALVALVVSGLTPPARSADPARVNWRNWDEAGLTAARSAGKSVYVFVASDLSELSRTSEREIFGRAETVEWLNANFTCLRVDADAQPEVAAYAQHFINSARQLKGWPVHLWLTPDLQPYEGANYLPPTEEWGRPGFLKSARGALEAWTQDPARVRAMAEEAIAQMSAPPPAASGPIDLEARLAKATAAWVAAADLKHGGFGAAPKHPEPELIRFLLTRGPEAKLAAIAAARAIVNGGLRDQDGGFFRRTIDAEWREPYRQKLLVDQARIALALYDAADAAQDDSLRAAADGALRWVFAALQKGEGFASGWDGTAGDGTVVGTAPTVAEGFLLAALARSRDAALQSERTARVKRWSSRIGEEPISLAHAAGSSESATPADLLALSLGLASRERADATARLAVLRLQRHAHVRYLDSRTGQFMASPSQLPAGIAVRVPALPDPFSVEALGLMAVGPLEEVRRALLAAIEYDELPSGAVLLGLSAAPR